MIHLGRATLRRLRPRHFDEPQTRYDEKALYYIFIFGAVVSPLLSSILLLLDPKATVGILIGFVMCAVLLYGVFLVHRQRYQTAILLMVASAFSAIFTAVFLETGIRSPSIPIIFVILMLSSMYMSTRASTVLSAATVAGLILGFLWEELGFLGRVGGSARPEQLDLLVVYCAAVLIVMLLMRISVVELQKRSEQTARLNEELKIEMAERQQAEAALRQQQKLESIGLLAGGVAHDFNNLLATILTHAEMAQVKISTGDGANQRASREVHEHLTKLANTSRRAANLTRQLLAYAGKSPFELSTFPLNNLIVDSRDLLQTSACPRARLTWQLAADLPLIHGDRAQLEQVLLNLVLNAAESIDCEVGHIVVATKAEVVSSNMLTASLADGAVNTNGGGVSRTVAGAAMQAGRYACLSVSDNGRGMAPHLLEKIFDPFFTTKPTSHGLGLSAILGVVRAHGGTISVESVLAGGTQISICLPVAPLTNGHATSAPLPATRPRQQSLPPIPTV